ncbi:MAG: thioredoxin [Saccharofermentans sp.]|nr:thioredoxin [Clostridiales bacterium]MCR5340824.1 thioredoxin [Saccharofermentans sp.]
MAEIVLTIDNFKTEVLESDIPVLVDFWAPWCGPCKMLGPVISQIAEEYEGKVKVGKVNVDDESELAMEYGIQSIPTVLLFKGGEVAEQSLGFKPKAFFEGLIG